MRSLLQRRKMFALLRISAAMSHCYCEKKSVKWVWTEKEKIDIIDLKQQQQ